MSDWFKRSNKGIQTPSKSKKDVPKGLWYKAPNGKIIDAEELKENLYVSPEDGYHVRIGSGEYFKILFDDGKYEELNKDLSSVDPLNFKDLLSYKIRIKEVKKKTKLKDAIRIAVGKSFGKEIVIGAMDFSFIGGSLGSVVGEKIVRAIDYAIKHGFPFLIISKSGGARMQEAPFSLMQMVKTSAKLTQLAKSKLPYISLCTDPTTGGTTASYAMLGDINIAEPNALIAFAGPRIVKDSTGKSLPEGFQRSEFLLEHGFLDAIWKRKHLKKQINLYIDLILNRDVRKGSLSSPNL